MGSGLSYYQRWSRAEKECHGFGKKILLLLSFHLGTCKMYKTHIPLITLTLSLLLMPFSLIAQPDRSGRLSPIWNVTLK